MCTSYELGSCIVMFLSWTMQMVDQMCDSFRQLQVMDFSHAVRLEENQYLL